jgi:hypothetical protein
MRHGYDLVLEPCGYWAVFDAATDLPVVFEGRPLCRLTGAEAKSFLAILVSRFEDQPTGGNVATAGAERGLEDPA